MNQVHLPVGHYFLQTPHVKPFFAHRLQYLQFLQALQGVSPLQVAKFLLTELFVGLMEEPLTMVPMASKEIRINFLIMIGFGLVNVMNKVEIKQLV